MGIDKIVEEEEVEAGDGLEREMCEGEEEMEVGL